VGIFAAFSESQKVKSVLASTGFAPAPTLIKRIYARALFF